ncbi:MAG: hypothetical protein RIS94_1644 [Pseudomonadota bacterium]|jgi:PQQ-dependent catabolism-associated CXXCW motif protein
MRSGFGIAAAVWLATAALPSSAAQGQGVTQADDFDATGFRIAHYRGPVDRDPAPATRLMLPDALRLRPGADALFIDVLPAEGGWRDPQTGRWRLAVDHQTIPGAVWHPETGRGPETGQGNTDPVLWAGLVRVVTQARSRHPAMPIVLFCRTDCWMGWNAARRLALAGFDGVHWLAEGIEGWHDAGRPLVRATPAVLRP